MVYYWEKEFPLLKSNSLGPLLTRFGRVIISNPGGDRIGRRPVNLHVDAYPSLKVKGKVESLAPATGATFSLVPQDTATGNFTKIVQRVPVRIALNQEALSTGLLRSGLAVVATVSTKPDCE